MSTIEKFDQTVLIERVKAGDRTAFELIFNHYYRGVVVFVRQFVIDGNQAEDIAQEMFVKLWEHRSRIDSTRSLKGLIFASARNESLNYLKHAKVAQKYVDRIRQLAGSHIAYNENLYVDSDLQQAIVMAVDHLPDRCREIFKMSRFEMIDNAEIAKRLGISQRTVETQISKALGSLRANLKDYLVLCWLIGAIIL